MIKTSFTKRTLTTLVFLLALGFSLQAQTLLPLFSGKRTSIRGVSVVNDEVAWVSGSSGWVARTVDKGKTWEWQQLAAYKTLDFRDIEAFSANSAIMVNAGSPAVILKTDDAGQTWKEVYRNDSPDIFLDGLDFWDQKQGIIFGDPIKNQLQLLKTVDGGNTWENSSTTQSLALAEGEAGFAASGTTIRTLKGGQAWIATGGKQSRIFYTADYGKTWASYACPIVQGKESTGPFSIAFFDKNKGVAVGGDYLKDSVRTDNMLLTTDGGKTWKKPGIQPFGYRSSVEYISKTTLVCTGTSGTDVSNDGGITWKKFSAEAFNTVRKAKSGSWIVLAGANGKIVSLNIDR